VRVEGLAVAGREGGHPVRLGLALVLEERVEVAVDHFPQNTVHPEDASAIDARVVERLVDEVLRHKDVYRLCRLVCHVELVRGLGGSVRGVDG